LSKTTSINPLKNELVGIGVIALALLMLVSVFAPNSELSSGEGVGAIGGFVARVLSSLTGDGKYLMPLIMVIWGVKLFLGRRASFFHNRMPGLVILALIGLAFFHMTIPAEFWTLQAGFAGYGGGAIGAALTISFTYLFGLKGSYIILSTLFFAGIVLATQLSLAQIITNGFVWFKKNYLILKERIVDFVYVTVEERDQGNIYKKVETFGQDEFHQDDQLKAQLHLEAQEVQAEQTAKSKIFPSKAKAIAGKKDVDIVENTDSVEDFLEILKDNPKKDFILPPISILQRNIQLKSIRMEKDITEKVKLLEETLASFGITAKVNQVSKGPAITRFEMQPAPGIKVSKIVNLADDIALALAASSIRIEAPIPGKAAVGIEIPNKEIGIVTFREVIESGDFQQASSKLTIALGKDIAGNPVIADLQSMPHLLIAGATGSGKSVCMNTVIASLLYKATPKELKLIMIDPKMVELTNYNSIPHLIAPVVTDSKKAAVSLKWVVEEMESRYELFAKNAVKDITRYNNLKGNSKKSETEEGLPYIVVLIDELADLMMVAPMDVEDAICRLAQMARAAGIHLVVATQRPSVDVITGLIKANIPSRIAFAVSSQTDSRTILDMGGAEKLLGRGDMLYYPTGAAKPVRVQGCFLSDKEVEDVVTFLKHQGKPEYLQGIMESQASAMKSDAATDNDPLFYEAAKLVIEQGQASISMVQRRLHIGYNRAARLIDLLEEQGIIGGYEGNKPRNILMTMDQLIALQDSAEQLQEKIQ
jgi:S-DNA-T family DNA segregation ATPase FtsK/SpoIIIE